MVAAELRDDRYARATQLLVVRNYGPSIAKNVRVTFDPPIPDPQDPSTSVMPYLKQRYSTPIATMTPGMELDNIYFTGRREGGDWVNGESTPDRVSVTVAYERTDGDPYVDVFHLNTDLIRQRTYATSSTAPEQQGKEIIKILKGIEKVLGRLAQRQTPGNDSTR
jgi:hypothetical protein